MVCTCVMLQVLSRWEAFLSQVKPSKGPVRNIYISYLMLCNIQKLFRIDAGYS